MGLRFFVLPALFHLQGLNSERFLLSTCTETITTKENLTFFGKAHTEIDKDSRLITRLLPGQESFKINSLMQANCWAIVPEGTEKIHTGENIEIAPLYPGGFLQ